VAAHSISPRPFARARERSNPTLSAEAVAAEPLIMAKDFARRRHRDRAEGPNPPTESIPKGQKSQPAVEQARRDWVTFAFSAISR